MKQSATGKKVSKPSTKNSPLLKKLQQMATGQQIGGAMPPTPMAATPPNVAKSAKAGKNYGFPM